MTPAQILKEHVAGLVPATRVLLRWLLKKDVGPRNKSGDGVMKIRATAP